MKNPPPGRVEKRGTLQRFLTVSRHALKLQDVKNIVSRDSDGTPKSRRNGAFHNDIEFVTPKKPTAIGENSRKRLRSQFASPVRVQKQRCRALIFVDHTKNDAEIPVSVRSLHKTQSASLLETSISSNEDHHGIKSPASVIDYKLKIVEHPQISHQAYRSISAHTLLELLSNMSKEQFNRHFLLVDCRYPYEYNGGHILHAINIYDLDVLKEFFFPDDDEDYANTSSKTPIFYCEYSQKRGPTLAMALRKHDRDRNEDNYPHVDYKEIYLLDRGYRNFHGAGEKYVNYCDPQAFIHMMHPKHAIELSKYSQHHKRTRPKQLPAFATSQSQGITISNIPPFNLLSE
jgi:rhodanese-related sulfurtransferase